jgi:DNA modification methylase
MVISISKIKPNPNNPRIIKDDKFKKLVKSLQDFPEMTKVRPIVVNKDMIVLGGNMRLKAMKEAGWKEVPVEIVDWPENKQKEFIIKDNVGFGEWEWELLANEWDAVELEEWGLDIPDFAFKNEEAQEDDYEIPDEIQTDIVLGDLFEIGEHRLLCGDSTDSDAVAKLMDGQKADMVFTDPPYNINYGNIKHPKFKQREIENDNMSGEDFESFCIGFISNIVLFNKGCVYMAGPPGPDGRIMFMAADKAMHCSTVIIWNKDQFTLGRGKYQNKYEPIWFGWVDNGTSFYGDRTQTNVWDIPRPKKSEEHPTMKPIELCAKGIGHASRKDDTVLDLFLGSGTTMVAAHQLNRKCYGMELDPKYCQVIVDRMLKLDPSIEIKRNGKPYQKP